MISVASPVPISLTILRPTSSTVHPKVPSDTWAAVFHARVGSNLSTDRQTVTGLGYTILAEERFSGSTHLYGYGPGTAVRAYVSDLELRQRLPGFFFQMVEGDDLTLGNITKWTSRQRVLR